MDSSIQIEEHAAAWLARRDSSSWTAVDDAALAEWLQSSTANRVAFLRLEAGWEGSGRMRTLHASRSSGTVPPRGAWRDSPFFQRRPPRGQGIRRTHRALKIVAAAASVVVVAGLGTVYLKAAHSGQAYSTPVGEVTSVQLQDGSLVTLNTASRIRVRLTQNERYIELEHGEAYFQVAREGKRPFVVEAANHRVVALGTQFSVRREGTDVQVVVADGAVQLEPEKGASGTGPLTPGSVVTVDRNQLLVRKQPLHVVQDALSWRDGYLTFDETQLVDAVAQFNRYTSHGIRIEDPCIATLRINGKFRAQDVQEFVDLLRNGFNIQTHDTDEAIVLTAQ